MSLLGRPASLRRLRRLRGASAATALSGFVAQAILVVSGVLVARLLPVDERGHLALMGLLPIIICQLGGLGLPLAVTYELARRPTGARALAAMLWRFVPLQALVLVLVHILTLLVLFRESGPHAWTAALCTIPAVPALLYQNVGLGVLQGQQRFTAFNVLRLTPVVSYAGVLVIAALAGVDSLVACAVGWTSAWVVAALLTMHRATRALRDAVGDTAVDRSAFFRFGRRGLLGAVFPVEAFQLDQLIVGVLFAPAALGLYVVAIALTNLPRFVAHSLGMVAYPRVAAQSDRRRGTRDVWRYVGIAMLAITPIVITLELAVGWLIPFFFGDAYAGAVPVARVLLVGALFQSARRVLADAARGLGHPELGTISEVASWVVLVPAIVVLEPRGLYGIALAMVLTYGFSLAVLVAGVLVSGGRSPHDLDATMVDIAAAEPAAPAAGEAAG